MTFASGDSAHDAPSAANSARFFTEAVRGGVLWTVRDADGIPVPINADGERAMPFWSLRSRAERVRDSSPEYHSFQVVSISLDDFRTNWLPGLIRDGIKVGVNWAGARATGYELSPEEVESRLAANAHRLDEIFDEDAKVEIEVHVEAPNVTEA